MKRILLIDATAREVREVYVQEGLQGWYNAIGCDLVTVVTYIGDQGDSLLVDDEGLLKSPKHFFLFGDYVQPLAGNGIIVGCDDEGETIDAKSSVEDIRGMVRFMDEAQVMRYIVEQEL